MGLLRPPLFLVALAAVPCVPVAQVVLSQDFDSGSLDVAASVVDASDPARPLVTLEPRRFSGAWSGDHWWISFDVSGVLGRTPRFRIPTANAFQPYSAGLRFVHSATPDDPASWSAFSSGSLSGGYYVFEDDEPFSADVVRVAYGIPYPTSRTAAHTASLVGHPLVAPTASGDAALAIGAPSGTAGGGYTDELGRTVPARALFAYRVAEPTSAPPAPPRARVVVTSGNHSGEASGTWTLQGFVDFCLSDDPEAVLLRSLAEVLVYPQSDPEGRWAGYFRSNPENPSANHNRWWNATAGFTELGVVTDAMRADTGGQVAFFLDFHSFGSPTGIGYYRHTQGGRSARFLQELLAREPALSDLGGPTTPGWAGEWAASAGGLGAEVSFTPETGFLAGAPVDRYLELGASWARALAATLAAPPPLEPGPRSSIAFRRAARSLAPQLWLRLDEPGPAPLVARDASGAGRDGAYVGGARSGLEDPFALGAGAAAGFDGVDDHVRVPDFAWAGTGEELTLAFWFRTSDVSGTGLQYLFSHGAVDTPQSLNVYFVESSHPTGLGPRLRTVYLDADDPTGYVAPLDVTEALAPLADGRWHLYTLVRSASEGAAVVLVDGIERARSSAVGGGAFDPPTDLFLAAREDLDEERFFGTGAPEDGLLDELLLLDRALDAAEVGELFASPPPAAWRLQEREAPSRQGAERKGAAPREERHDSFLGTLRDEERPIRARALVLDVLRLGAGHAPARARRRERAPGGRHAAGPRVRDAPGSAPGADRLGGVAPAGDGRATSSLRPGGEGAARARAPRRRARRRTGPRPAAEPAAGRDPSEPGPPSAGRRRSGWLRPGRAGRSRSPRSRGPRAALLPGSTKAC